MAHARHSLSIKEYTGDATDFVPWNPGGARDYIERSALGLARIYNMIPARFVEGANTVQLFQASLQNMAKQAAEAKQAGLTNWRELFSPRIASLHHPLRQSV